jgi:hypothetical protein
MEPQTMQQPEGTLFIAKQLLLYLREEGIDLPLKASNDGINYIDCNSQDIEKLNDYRFFITYKRYNNSVGPAIDLNKYTSPSPNNGYFVTYLKHTFQVYSVDGENYIVAQDNDTDMNGQFNGSLKDAKRMVAGFFTRLLNEYLPDYHIRFYWD